MAMTSLFRRMDLVSADICERSLPASSGEARIAHKLMWVRYSLYFIPPLPTSSISGSFQWPGPAYLERPAWENPMLDMLMYLSWMSSVVRQLFPPTLGP